MTKYMQKELQQSGKFRPRERRFGFSRGWNSPFLLSSYRYYFRYLPMSYTRMTFDYDPDMLGNGRYDPQDSQTMFTRYLALADQGEIPPRQGRIQNYLYN